MKNIFFIFLIFYSSVAFSQPVTQEWVRTYNNPENDLDWCEDIKVDNNGNVFVTGTNVTTTQGNNITTIKYNSEGTQQWVKVFNSGGSGYNDLAVGLVLDTAGNAYVAGYTGQNFGPYDIILIKYDINGVQQWIKYFDGGDDDVASDIKIDKNNFIYLSGATRMLSGDIASIILKYNYDGDTVWVRKMYLAGTNRSSLSIAIDTSGSIYGCGGTVTLVPYERREVFAVKYNSDGVQQWQTTYNGGGNNWVMGSGIDVDWLGNTYIEGYKLLGSLKQFLTLKLNQAGGVVWDKTFSAEFNSNNNSHLIKVSPNGNHIYVGGTISTVASSSDFQIVQYNSAGDTLWTRRYNGPANGSDGISDMVMDDSLNIYVTGSSVGNGTSYDCATIKYDKNGQQKWLVRYNGPSGNKDDYSASITLDNQNNFYICGKTDLGSFNPEIQYDFLTIKYSQLLPVEPISNKVPHYFTLYQNYPNPFNPNTKISFSLPPSKGARGMNMKLTIFDVLGKEIAVLVNQQLTPGTYEVEWDAGNYPSGVYFYTLQADKFTDTRKMILIK
jgi:hypothetical protein